MSGVRKSSVAALAVVFVALVWSGWAPKERFTWFLEVVPILVAIPIALATAKKFPWSTLVTTLLAIHAVILCVGGHWTYAEVPFGFWMAEAFGFSRNHYDRIGHFAQGFVPAIVVREFLLRKSPLRRGPMLVFLVTSVCLAISAAYELFEWLAAVTTADGATAFLGTQGDVWDTQTDMLLALVGALTAQAVLSRLHDRSLSRLPKPD